MKKVLLTIAVAVLGVLSVNAQEGQLRVGAHLGLTVGELSDFFSINTGADAAYLLGLADGLNVGVATGYSHYIGKTTKIGGVSIKSDGIGIVPLAGSAEYVINDAISIGVDLGYAFFVGKNIDGGGFYYQPKLGYKIGSNTAYIGYKGVEDNVSLSSVNLGYIIGF